MSGVTSGFGSQWFTELDKQYTAEFFILARDRNRLHTLIQRQQISNKVHFVDCDLSSLKSIKLACQYISSRTDHIDVLINNAGVWAGEVLELSEDDIEMTCAVNVVAPYYLTGHLLPLLSKAQRASIVNTASFRHRDAKVNQSDIEMLSNYCPEQAYCNSKLYTILLTKQLANLLANTNIYVNCFDPGIVDTPMLKQAFPKNLGFIYPLFKKLIARTPTKGAQTGVFLSDSDNYDVSGEYFKDHKVKSSFIPSHSQELTSWLWSECETLTGFVYPLGINFSSGWIDD